MPQSSFSATSLFTDPLVLLALCAVLVLTGCTLRKNNVVTTPTPQAEAVDVLLIAYDNGDGRAFRTLLPELDEKNIHWHLVAFGPAAALFEEAQFEGSPNITRLNQTASPEQIKEWLENRYSTLPNPDVNALTNRYAPRVVLSGMAHTIQAQLTQQWWQQGSWTIAFYDNMEPPAGQLWVKPWFDANPPVEQLMVTTRPLLKSFPEKMARSGKITQVYHPAVKEWQEVFDKEDSDALKQILELDDRPVVLVAGGYGNEYQNSLKVIQTAAALREDLQWVLTPHPRTLLTSEGKHTDNSPLKAITDIPTVRVATLASAIVTHRSTVGWLGSQLGIPVIFVRPEGHPEILENGRIRIVNNETALLNALYRQLDSPAQQVTSDNSQAKSIADVLEHHLKDQKPSSLKVESVNDVRL